MPQIPVLNFAATPGGSFPAVLTGDTSGEHVRRPSGGPPLLVLRDRTQIIAALTDPAVVMAGAAGGVITRFPLTGAELQNPDGGWLNMDGKSHRVYRQRTGHLFTSHEAGVTSLFARLTALNLAAALPHGEITDVRAAFTRPFAEQAICGVFGIPGEDWPQIDRASRVAFAVVPSPQAVPAVAAAWEELYAYWEPQIASRVQRPDGSLATRLIGALSTRGYGTKQIVHSLGVVSNGFGAFEPVLSVMMAELAAGTPPPHLIDVEGMLHGRAMFPVTLPRLASADTWLAGRHILAGTLLLPSLAAARQPFGAGPHTCPGDSLTRVWLLAALRVFWNVHPGARLAGELRWVPGTLATPLSIPLALP
jgi:cytochrome P450